MPALSFGVCRVHGSSAVSSPVRELRGLPARCPGKRGMLSMQGNPARGCWKSLVSAPFHVSACARGDGGSSADAAWSRGARHGAGRARPGHGGARPCLMALLAELAGKLPSRQAVLLALAEPDEDPGGLLGVQLGKRLAQGSPGPAEPLSPLRGSGGRRAAAKRGGAVEISLVTTSGSLRNILCPAAAAGCAGRASSAPGRNGARSARRPW